MILGSLLVGCILSLWQFAQGKRLFDAGDIVGDYHIYERIDYLGYQKTYAIDDSAYNLWARGIKQISKVDATTDKEDNADVSNANDDSLTVLHTVNVPRNSSCIQNGTFCLNDHIFRGGHGDIYRAFRINGGSQDRITSYILKRMNILDRPNIELCAKREIYFGKLLSNRLHTTRYVSFFKTTTDYWLVFRDEGISLQQLLYAMSVDAFNVQLQPSNAWRRLRTTVEGQHTLKSILQKIIANVAELHRQGIYHRDIKLSNILLNAEHASSIRLLIGDFSSAVSDEALRLGLFGAAGPTTEELTAEYEPPEVRLRSKSSGEGSNQVGFDPLHPTAYDIWTVGQLFLEMILATPNVFDADQRATALIHQRLRKKRLPPEEFEEEFKKAVFLAALSEYCLLETPTHTAGQPSIQHTRRHPDEGHYSMVSSIIDENAIGDNSHGVVIRDAASLGESVLHSLVDDDTALTSFREESCTAISQDSTAVACIDKRLENEAHNATKQLLLDAISDYRTSLFPLFLYANAAPMVDDMELQRPARSRRVLDKKESTSCNLNNFRTALLRRDSLGVGFSDEWGLDLAMKLLHWDPASRISMEDALQHAYFVGPYTSYFDGSSHATKQEMFHHDSRYRGTVQSTYETMQKESNDEVFQHGDIILNGDSVDADEGSYLMPLDADMEVESSSGIALVEEIAVAEVTDRSQAPLPIDGASIGLTHTASTREPILHSNLDLPFSCPKCRRKFADWHACSTHIHARNHGDRCNFPGSLIPACISYYPLHPLDPNSGWCDLQGRRQYIEDLHATAYSEFYQYFGVFDGHFGSRTARIASKYLHKRFQYHLHKIEQRLTELSTDLDDGLSANSTVSKAIRMEKLNPASGWQRYFRITNDDEVVYSPSLALQRDGVTASQIEAALQQSFLDVDGEVPDSSGSAVALLVLFQDVVVVANLGDCRVVLCCSPFSGRPLQLTVDHTPDDPLEHERILVRGGWVSRDRISRVNGILAVTRSLGDKALKQVVSSSPDIMIFDRHTHWQADPSVNDTPPAPASVDYCRHFRDAEFWMLAAMYPDLENSINLNPPSQLFSIVASDGLWDVVSNDDAVHMVCAFFLTKLQRAATRLSEQQLHANSEMHPRNNINAPASLPWMAVSVNDFVVAHSDNSQDDEFDSSLSSALLDQDESTQSFCRPILPRASYQQAAMLLAQEAWVRGSSDNIGVSVVNMLC